MKLPFVTRKKYEIEKENLRKINNQRIAIEKENKEYQERILWLNNRLKELKTELEIEIDKNKNNKLMKTLQTDKCKKCGDTFIKTQKNRKFCDNCKRKKSK